MQPYDHTLSRHGALPIVDVGLAASQRVTLGPRAEGPEQATGRSPWMLGSSPSITVEGPYSAASRTGRGASAWAIAERLRSPARKVSAVGTTKSVSRVPKVLPPTMTQPVSWPLTAPARAAWG